MKTITVPIIKSDSDLKMVLKTFDRLFMAEAGTLEAERREILALVIESYERKHFPIEAPDFVTAIKFAMEQRNYSREKVGTVLGGASRLSEILNGKRKLSLSQIRALNLELKIPFESLMKSPADGFAPIKRKSGQVAARKRIVERVINVSGFDQMNLKENNQNTISGD